MKMSILLFAFFCLLSSFGNAQRLTTITIHAGESFDKLNQEIYAYPTFAKGYVTYNHGKTYRSLFNYNLLSGTVQFISEKGDTVDIANENTVSYIIIGKETFLYNKEYLKIISGNKVATLAEAKRVKLSDQKKIGAYGIANSANSISTYTTHFAYNSTNKLILQEDLVFTVTRKFYIIDANDKPMVYNKRNLLKTFPEASNKIEMYLKNKPIDFNSEQDLKQLTEYLKNLN